MRRKFLLPLALLLLLTGCTAGGAAPETSRYAPEDAQRLVIYTSHKEEIYWPIIQEFEQRTGIWVEVVTGGTNELLERIEREKNAPAADVMFGGGVESLGSYQDCFTPYTSSQAQYIQERFRDEEGLWTPFSALPVVLIYNTKLVEPEQITGWSDLLSPDFQGRIAFADPGVSGSCFTGLVTLMYAVEGEDALQRFAENLDGRQLDDSGNVLTSVAGGTDLVGITLEGSALQRMAAGDDIALVYPADGTSCVPDASALLKGAPHEDNARLFLDFTVSRDAQELLAAQFYRRPVRSDVEPGLELTGLSDFPLIDYDADWASDQRQAILMTWAFYLGGEESP